MEHPRQSGGELLVVGTGIQWAGQATLAAQRAIAGAEQVFFAVVDPFTVRWIRELNSNAESLPYALDDSPRRDSYAAMVERIIGALETGKRVCAVFYGHPGVLTSPTHELMRQAQLRGFDARMLPGVSSLACLFADVGLDPGQRGCHIFEATDFLIRTRSHDVYTPLVLLQIGFIGNLGFFDASATARIRRGLAVLTDVLCERYPRDTQIVLYEAAVLPVDAPRTDTMPLHALPDAAVHDLTTLYIPPSGPAPMDTRMVARLGMNIAALSNGFARSVQAGTFPTTTGQSPRGES